MRRAGKDGDGGAHKHLLVLQLGDAALYCGNASLCVCVCHGVYI